MTRDLTADLQLALELADLADRVALARFGGRDFTVARKADASLVTEADREVEVALREHLRRYRPGDAILGEEFEPSVPDGDGWTWILDPIDGTSNYARGVPVWASLIGLAPPKAQPVVGVVSAPALTARWWAAAGRGAFRDGRPIHVSDTSALAEAFVSLALPDGQDPGLTGALAELQRRCWRVRGFGDFWAHMLVAEGAIDACLDVVGTAPYDLAAVQVVVIEAGGTLTDHGGRPGYEGGSALSSNGPLHPALLDVVRRSAAEGSRG